MPRERSPGIPPVVWALIAGGGVYFASAVGFAESSTGKTALLVVALCVLLQLTRLVDPAWLLSAGILSTMFAGHWDSLGLDSSVGPHRVILGAGILALLLRAPPARDRAPLHLTKVHFALAAALAYAAISALAAGTLGRQTAYFGLFDHFGALPFLMFTVAPLAFATPRQRNILLGSLVAAGLYLSVTAVLEKLDLNSLIWPRYVTDPGVGLHFGRSRGPFADAGADGLALYATAVAGAIGYVVWREPWQRLAGATVALVAPVGMLLTVTRGIWLAAILATALVFVTTAELRRFIVPIAAAGTVLVLASFALIPGLARQASNRQKDKSPVYERQNTSAAGLRMVADRPLLGFGWDRANDRLEPYFDLQSDIPLIGLNAGLHDIYLQYLVALGALGFGIWLLAGLLAFGGALGRRAPPDVRPWQIGLKGVLAASLVVGLTTPSAYIFTTTLFWTLGGIVWGATAAAHAPARSAFSRNGREAALAPAGAVLR